MPDWKIKRFAEMILERVTDAEKTNFIKKYVYATDENDDPLPGLVRDMIIDIVHISNDPDLTNAESKTKQIIDDLVFFKEPYATRILYPFPTMYSNVFRFRNGKNSVRRGGKRRRRHAKSKKCKK